MRFAIVVILGLLVSLGRADTVKPNAVPKTLDEAKAIPWRVKVRALNEGELVTWPKQLCNNDVNEHLRRVVMKHPYIEVMDGKTMAARLDEKRPIPAHRQGGPFVGFYDVTETRTIAFSLRWDKAKENTVPVEISIIDYGAPGNRENPDERIKACRETWLGPGYRI